MLAYSRHQYWRTIVRTPELVQNVVLEQYGRGGKGFADAQLAELIPADCPDPSVFVQEQGVLATGSRVNYLFVDQRDMLQNPESVCPFCRPNIVDPRHWHQHVHFVAQTQMTLVFGTRGRNVSLPVQEHHVYAILALRILDSSPHLLEPRRETSCSVLELSVL